MRGKELYFLLIGLILKWIAPLSLESDHYRTFFKDFYEYSLEQSSKEKTIVKWFLTEIFLVKS